MPDLIDTLLLLALPASGKSELRRYLAAVDEDVARRDFGLGPTVDLDDYPYVHFMRRIDEELESSGSPRAFYDGSEFPFRDGRDWATLIHLLNGDYAALGQLLPPTPDPTRWLLGRIARARAASGIDPALPDWPPALQHHLADRLDDEVGTFAQERADTIASHRAGTSTVLVEFARGGPAGADLPLLPPHGYAFSLAALDDGFWARSKALYVWVTPEESRRRNRDRAKPGREGDASILHHGVPERVMLDDYGTDDFLWLLEQGGGEALVLPDDPAHARIPAAVFDNRVDRTSFLRADPNDWDDAEVADLHDRLTRAFRPLAE